MKALGLEETSDFTAYTGGYLVLVNVPVAIANAMSSSHIPTICQEVFSKGEEVM